MFLLRHLFSAMPWLFSKAYQLCLLLLLCGFLLCACSSSSDSQDEEEPRTVQPPPPPPPVQPPPPPPPVQPPPPPPPPPPPMDEVLPTPSTTSQPVKTTETISGLQARLHRLIQQTDAMLLKVNSDAFDWSVFPSPGQSDLQARIVQQSSAVQQVRERLSVTPEE